MYHNMYNETPYDIEWINNKRKSIPDNWLLPRYGRCVYPNGCGTNNIDGLNYYISNYNDAQFTPVYTHRFVSLNNILIEEKLKTIYKRLDLQNIGKWTNVVNPDEVNLTFLRNTECKRSNDYETLLKQNVMLQNKQLTHSIENIKLEINILKKSKWK